MIHVIAIITAHPGQREAVLALLTANAPEVLRERGCIAYEATVDTEGAGPFQAVLGPDTFACVEKWDSVDALTNHIAAPHMIAYAAKTRPLVAHRSIHVLSAV